MAMNAAGRLYGCPVELTLDLLGGKWKTVILARLKQHPMSYAELRRQVPQITEKMLTQRLRDLRHSGLIERVAAGPRRSRYALSARGRTLHGALAGLYDWGLQIAPQVGARFRPSG
jgi:DNA-binding HxlR family transcriptional regulator